MASTGSIRRDRAGALAISFFETHEDEIFAGAKERLFSFLKEGELEPDLRLLIKLVARRIEYDLSEVIGTDKAVIDERDNDIELRLELEEASGEVHEQLVFVRQILTGLYGDKRAKEILATDGETAQVTQPNELWRQGDDTLDRLRRGDLEKPKKNTTSVKFTAKDLADELEPPVTRMDTVRKKLDEERRKMDAKVVQKEEAMATFDSDFRGSVRLGVGMCILVGRPKLGRKLRTAVLRAPQRGASGGNEPSEDDQPTQDQDETQATPAAAPAADAPAS